MGFVRSNVPSTSYILGFFITGMPNRFLMRYIKYYSLGFYVECVAISTSLCYILGFYHMTASRLWAFVHESIRPLHPWVFVKVTQSPVLHSWVLLGHKSTFQSIPLHDELLHSWVLLFGMCENHRVRGLCNNCRVAFSGFVLRGK